MEIRIAGPDDADGLSTLLAEVFSRDPVWGWAFPDPERLRAWWRLFVGSALRYPCTWIAGDVAAAAMWIPPGGTELTAEDEALVEPLIRELAGDRARDVIELVERFEAAHPDGPPHYYLSLLGTAPAHRGNGIGMALLRESLRRMAPGGAPAYLESSNPDNNARYEREGFRAIGSFSSPGGQVLTTMWRDAG